LDISVVVVVVVVEDFAMEVSSAEISIARATIEVRGMK
jgi:hypothetical protein